MCGRYRLSRRKQIIEEYFDTSPWENDWSPRFNIAPTQSVPVIRQHPKEPVRQISLMKWGLIPHWAKDPSVAEGTINAKSETASEKPAFRDPMKFRRCLIPADGFYEWKKTGGTKQPFCFEVGAEFFRLHKQLVEQGLAGFSSHPRIHAKYRWLKRYHNSRLPRVPLPSFRNLEIS